MLVARDLKHRILSLDDVGTWLGLWPASREASPMSLKWLLEKERDLQAELEPVVGEIAASYVAEFDKALKDILAKSGPLTEKEMAALDVEVGAMLVRAGKELGKDAGPIVGGHTAGVYTKIRETVGKKISFNRIDKAAVKWMGKDPHYWIQDYFGKSVSLKLQAIGQSALVEGMGRKELAETLKARFAGEVDTYRYWDVLGSAQLNRSRSWGMYESMDGEGVTKVQWSAAGDERQCETCSALDGTEFEVKKAVDRQRKIVADDMSPDEYKDQNPWVQSKKGEDGTEFYWKDSDGESHDLTDEFNALTPGAADDGSDLQDIGIQAPPAHGACLLPGTMVQGAILAASKARYTGQAVKLRTAVERGLSVTANHPVLTDKGFVPAGSIRKGDKLVCYLGETGIAFGGWRNKVDKYHAPTAIEEVFRAFADRRTPVYVTASADDFHGDAAGFDGEVHIVGTNRILLSAPNASHVEQAYESVLEVSAAGDAFIAGAGGSELFVDGFDAPSTGSPRARALPFNGVAVQFERGPLEPFRVGPTADWDVLLAQAECEGTPADLQLVRELLERFPGQVALDEVIDVERFAWDGHVYDLQTVNGWMVAGNTVVSNCRCCLNPVD